MDSLDGQALSNVQKKGKKKKKTEKNEEIDKQMRSARSRGTLFTTRWTQIRVVSRCSFARSTSKESLK